MPHEYTTIDCNLVLQHVSEEPQPASEIADDVGVSRTTMWKLTGGCGPFYRARTDVVARLAQRLGTTIERIEWRGFPSDGVPAESWSIELDGLDSSPMQWTADCHRDDDEIEMMARSDEGDLQVSLMVKGAVVCGVCRLRTHHTELKAAVWGLTEASHYLTLDGNSLPAEEEGGPLIKLFARRN